MKRLQPIAPRSVEPASQVTTVWRLHQVAMLANSVTRLMRKMQNNHGHLSALEQAQYDLQLRMLDAHMVQLQHDAVPHQFLHHTTTTSPPHFYYHHHRQQHQHLPFQQPTSQPFPHHNNEEDKARTVADTSSMPSSPNAMPQRAQTEAGSPGRRRTKRLFHDRACQDCDTRFTSQWRTGPAGPSTLCNACGIRYARKSQAGKSQRVTPSAEVSSTRSSIQFLLN